MKKPAIASSPAQFEARVVYGFRQKLETVILGKHLSGKLEKGMFAQVALGTQHVGCWEVAEILHMDYINDIEDGEFLGLVIKCKDEADFNLLRTLRVYGETLLVQKM